MYKMIELKYGHTKCYLIQGAKKTILIDTDWAGTLTKFFRSLGEHKLRVQEIDYLFITHYHPDHMGLAQTLVDYGCQLVVLPSQVNYLHQADTIFARQGGLQFEPINDQQILRLPFQQSRAFLAACGLRGQIIRTPGHSQDSVSYVLDDGAAFVGDLYPLEQVPLYHDPALTQSWQKLRAAQVKVVHYAHYPDQRITDWSVLD